MEFYGAFLRFDRSRCIGICKERIHYSLPAILWNFVEHLWAEVLDSCESNQTSVADFSIIFAIQLGFIRILGKDILSLLPWDFMEFYGAFVTLIFWTFLQFSCMGSTRVLGKFVSPVPSDFVEFL